MREPTPQQPADRDGRTVSRRSFLRLLGAGAGAGMLAACAPTAPQPAAPAAAPTATEAAPAAPPAGTSAEDGMLRPGGTPKRGGVLRTAFGITTAHFDIHQGATVSVLCHLYNNLARNNLVDGLRTIVPDLAQSWEVSADGLTYTFHLRDGVIYHDGTPFSADDVVASFTKIIDPPEGVVSVAKTEFAMVSSVTALDARTIQFVLSSPRAFFLSLLAATTAVIYSKKTLDEYKYDLREVVAPGTGAFRFVEYKTAESWTMERNPDYWDAELPYIDGLQLLHVPAWSDRGTAVLTDQADLSWNVAFETWTEGEKRSDIVQVNKLANFGAYWVLFNTQQPPFDDTRVRRAIHLGVSKQNMIGAFSTQEQINLTRWVPQGDPFATPPEVIATLPGYRADKTEDIAAAKALLAEAGFAEGISGVELLAAAGPQAELLAPAFQDMLKRNLNIDATIRIIERSQLPEEERNGTFQMVLDTPGHGVSDISPRANNWWKTGGSQNWGKYSNPEFDSLLAQIDVETDPLKRQAMIAQAEELLDADPPWYLVGYTWHLPMWNNRVKGLFLDIRAYVEWGRIETAWLDT